MKHGITMRGDSLYCPLPLSIEPYWWCEPNCPHCYFRGLNHIWGKEYRPIDLPALRNKLKNGLKNNNPRTAMAHALAQKKTIRVGNKTDPFQPIESKLLRSTGALKILTELEWSYVVQTRFPTRLNELALESLLAGREAPISATVLVMISPGWVSDWETLERKQTDPIPQRIRQIKEWLRLGIAVGVNGEPFIPGYHTTKDFERTLRKLKEIGIKSYNTYNFHFTPHVAKRLAMEVPSMDIEKVWYSNQDRIWKPILAELLTIAKKYDMILGCPDFVNSGPDYREKANTCCGISVPNPCLFNTHNFKRLAQEGKNWKEIIDIAWDGTGNLSEGEEIVKGTRNTDHYTLRDAGVLPNDN